MALIPLEEPTTKRIPPETFSLWALAFRPLYLLAAILAAVAIPVWAVAFSGGLELPIPGIWWHAHEMIFGFAVAVIIGFLLTAGRNWTGLDTPTDGLLAMLAALWLAGRLAMAFGSGAWVAVVDLAFLPIAVIGFLLSDWIESLFNVQVVAWMFIIGGIIFLVVEHFYRDDTPRVRVMETLSYTQAAWVGFAQLFALVPGTSRAGATIIGGMLAGLDRKASAEFSFLLALPVLGASSGYSLLKHYDEFANTSFTPLIVGFLVAFVVAYLTMKLFLGFLERFTFRAFGIYRILFGVLLLWWTAH